MVKLGLNAGDVDQAISIAFSAPLIFVLDFFFPTLPPFFVYCWWGYSTIRVYIMECMRYMRVMHRRHICVIRLPTEGKIKRAIQWWGHHQSCPHHKPSVSCMDILLHTFLNTSVVRICVPACFDFMAFSTFYSYIVAQHGHTHSNRALSYRYIYA